MEVSQLELPGIPKLRSGKVREVFDLGSDGFLLVATDRLSAFDCILPDPIPRKGAVLTQLSAFWFHHLRSRGSMADHLVTAEFADFPARLQPFAEQLAGRSMIVQRAGALHALERGIIIADTKFEFGVDEQDGEIMLIDECLTPDSSRFWPAGEYAPGGSPPSFDKQYVRDYLETLTWDKTPPGPRLPEEIIARTSGKYLQAYEALTGGALAT